MIKIYDFSNCLDSGLVYGGHAGDKLGIVFNKKEYLVKFPGSTEHLEKVSIPFVLSPLSEYIGSNIYKTLGIDTHETLLGVLDKKVVVACLDFRDKLEDFVDYNHLKNKHDKEVENALSKVPLSYQSIRTTNLDELKIVMNNNSIFLSHPELKTRFWDMFVIDAFIGNNDRNEGNWGMILNRETKSLKLAPVFDNGASFFNKSSDNKMHRILENNKLHKDAFYNGARCAFEQNGKQINPLKYIKSMNSNDCNDALLRIVPKIKTEWNNIINIIESIPNSFDGIEIISEIRKEYYILSLKYVYENVLEPTYEKLLNKNN